MGYAIVASIAIKVRSLQHRQMVRLEMSALQVVTVVKGPKDQLTAPQALLTHLMENLRHQIV